MEKKNCQWTNKETEYFLGLYFHPIYQAFLNDIKHSDGKTKLFEYLAPRVSKKFGRHRTPKSLRSKLADMMKNFRELERHSSGASLEEMEKIRAMFPFYDFLKKYTNPVMVEGKTVQSTIPGKKTVAKDPVPRGPSRAKLKAENLQELVNQGEVLVENSSKLVSIESDKRDQMKRFVDLLENKERRKKERWEYEVQKEKRREKKREKLLGMY